MSNVGIKNFVYLIHLLEFLHELVWSFVLPWEDDLVGGGNTVDLCAFLKASTWTPKSKCIVDLSG